MKAKISKPVAIAILCITLVVLAVLGWRYAGPVHKISPEEMRANMAKGNAQHKSP